jgi:site-specific recombinase XerD
MKSNQKLSILLWLFKAKATKDGKAPIYARITIDGKDDEISLGRKTLPEFWDTKNKIVTSGGMEAKVTNQRILQIQTDLDRHFMVLQTQHEDVTPAMLKNVYKGLPALHKKGKVPEQSPDQQTLLGYFDSFIAKFAIQVEKGLRDKGTLRQWTTTRSKVVSFLAFRYRAKDIHLTDIDHSFADDFYDFLTLHVPEPLAEITAKKHVKKTRQILKIAIRKKVIASNPLEGFNCSGGDKEVQPLELDQVEAIYRKRLKIQRLDKVRDAFIFQCFTGFAYQDIYNLSPENIVRVGRKGERWLIKERGKTQVPEMVPILPIVEELIEKYKDHPDCKANNRLMPINSNYRYNVYLKELADICGITFENISVNNQEFNTHLARHTFANIMLNNGVPLEDVSKMLGHKSIRTTQKYARVNKYRISENVAGVAEKLFTKTGKLKKVTNVSAEAQKGLSRRRKLNTAA